MSVKTRILLLSAALMLCCPAALAQVTKVRGLVVDGQTGEPLPYVSVFFTGTTIGVATDMDGRYYMETRDTSATELQATLIGYKTAVQAVSRGAFSEINFTLEPNPDELSASVIKPDRQRMRNFLKRLDESRILHNPNQYYRWGVQVYTRMELDAANSDWMVNMPLLKSTLAPIAECRDTSTVSGVAYYPALISETISHQYHDLNGPVDKEIIEANRITGVESDNFMTQYTGNYLL
ncbi:MAG: carboxypeptidase-like regulatory domain-containing protein, partial [Bacteroidales bacterium]|nr:carboxypeptidase-like regulatory domain-containing protein [Bacteroidales bacterium]